MTPDPQALMAKIQALSEQIIQLQATLVQSTDPSERARLNARVASMQQTRQSLRSALSNLQP